ncbi:hypothetical protein M8C21_001217, partial [Ambrosia artemisiifolia]
SKMTRCCIGWKSFWLIFLAGLIGITISQMIFLEGLYLASSSAGSAIFNLVPAITFVAASIVGSCCWSFWLIIQVQITKSYPDHLSLSAWMCFITTLQSGTVILFTDPHLEAWKVSSYLQVGSLLYAATAGSGISIFAQSWIVQKRGPVFSAMFNPLNTVIVTIFASIFLREQVYAGSVIGAVGIVIGLYVVLWGKAKDLEELKEQQQKKMMISQKDQINVVQILVDEASLEEPLLPNQTNKI